MPTIPSEVNSVNFTWESGKHNKYYYVFDQLQSHNENILKSPNISINLEGKVPQGAKGKQRHTSNVYGFRGFVYVFFPLFLCVPFYRV